MRGDDEIALTCTTKRQTYKKNAGVKVILGGDADVLNNLVSPG